MRRTVEVLSHIDMALSWFGLSLPSAVAVLFAVFAEGPVLERFGVGVAVFAVSWLLLKGLHHAVQRPVRIAVQPLWDDVGSTFVSGAGDGHVRRAWSAYTDIEIANAGRSRLTAERAYLEFLTPRLRYLRKRNMQWLADLMPLSLPGAWVIFADAPVVRAGETGRGQGALPPARDGRIDLILEPGLPPQTITVEFNVEWPVGDRGAPELPELFDSRIRIDFTDGRESARIKFSPLPAKAG